MQHAVVQTLVMLLAAHMVADFTLQGNWMVANKRRWPVMALHILIVTSIAALALGWFDWPVLAWIAGTHLAMDVIKTRLLASDWRAFAIDQAAHLLVILCLALGYPDAGMRGVWTLLPTVIAPLFPLALLAVAALIAVTTMGGIIIGLWLKRLSTEEIASLGGLTDGGRYIGWLERALTLLFVAIDQPTGVGLLLAAKSILRFGDIKDSNDRARAEYIMIGTFMSIGWALFIAVAARQIAHRLTM